MNKKLLLQLLVVLPIVAATKIEAASITFLNNTTFPLYFTNNMGQNVSTPISVGAAYSTSFQQPYMIILVAKNMSGSTRSGQSSSIKLNSDKSMTITYFNQNTLLTNSDGSAVTTSLPAGTSNIAIGLDGNQNLTFTSSNLTAFSSGNVFQTIYVGAVGSNNLTALKQYASLSNTSTLLPTPGKYLIYPSNNASQLALYLEYTTPTSGSVQRCGTLNGQISTPLAAQNVYTFNGHMVNAVRDARTPLSSATIYTDSTQTSAFTIQ